MSADLVAPRRTAANGFVCKVCQLPAPALQAVNAAIWDGSEQRVKGYRLRGVEAYNLVTAGEIDVKTITSHADHVEASWREPTEQRPPTSNEVAVFPHDYEGITESAAKLGARAMSEISNRVDRMADRDLVSVAKLGVQARSEQHKAEVASKTPKIELTAIFGLASGHLAQLPESEAIDVTPESDLLDGIHQERKQLEAHARG